MCLSVYMKKKKMGGEGERKFLLNLFDYLKQIGTERNQSRFLSPSTFHSHHFHFTAWQEDNDQCLKIIKL